MPNCFCCDNGPDGSGRCTHKDYPHGQPPIEHCTLPEGHEGSHYYSSMDRKVEELYKMPDKTVEPTHTFSSGAKSSGKLPRYDMIPWSVFADRLAARYELGLKKYSEDNWRTGLSEREYVLDRANHALKHLHRAVEAIRTGKKLDEDDDLAAAMWGVICLMASQVPQASQAPTLPKETPTWTFWAVPHPDGLVAHFFKDGKAVCGVQVDLVTQKDEMLKCDNCVEESTRIRQEAARIAAIENAHNLSGNLGDICNRCGALRSVAGGCACSVHETIRREG